MSRSQLNGTNNTTGCNLSPSNSVSSLNQLDFRMKTFSVMTTASQDTLQAMMIPGTGQGQGSFTNSLPTSSSSVSRDICGQKATSPQGCPPLLKVINADTAK